MNATQTYAIQHPDMSEAVIVDAHAARTEKGLIAQVAMYMLRNFDVALDTARFVIVPVDSDTPTPIDLFDAEYGTEAAPSLNNNTGETK